MDHDLRPVYPGARPCGAALTVQCPPGDNLMVHQALAIVPPGSVLVVSTGRYLEGGCFGEMAAAGAQVRGVVGLICDGAVRDVTRLQELGFPVFARGVSMKGTTKVKAGLVNHPLVFCGTLVRPGDAVLGDADGVVVVPQEELPRVLQAARAKEEAEQAIIVRVRNGESTLDRGRGSAGVKAKEIPILL